MRSAVAERARERNRAAKRRVIAATLLSCGLAAAVVWVMLSNEPSVEPATVAATGAATDDETWTVPESDADVLLVWGGESTTLDSRALPGDRALSLDLALPVSLDGPDELSVRIYSQVRGWLDLEGRVHGDARNLVQLEIPGGHFVPGSYLVQLHTTEPNAAPVRRFALIVE